MYISPHEQGSDQWHLDRLGIATASCFASIMTPKLLKRAKTDYIYLLASEAITQKPQSDDFDNKHMARGRELEDCAIAMYELDHDVDVNQVGLCKQDELSLIGFSPDGLIGSDGGLELKCPQLKKHLQYIDDNKVPDEYLSQVYGSLHQSKREYWDFMSYNEVYRPFYIRVNRDDEAYLKWVAAFEKIWPEFQADLIKLIEKSNR